MLGCVHGVQMGTSADIVQVPWSQEHFEELLAKWVAACDQPFMAVTRDEFRELLQYTHHHSPMPLKIPSGDSVKLRIEKMNKEMVEGLKKIFKVRISEILTSSDVDRDPGK